MFPQWLIAAIDATGPPLRRYRSSDYSDRKSELVNVGHRPARTAALRSSVVQVLICDDEPAIRLLFRSAFEIEGVHVTVACDGDEAIAKAMAEHPDLVILDIRMPNRDGLSTLAELRTCCPEIRVMLVSAEPSVEVFMRGRDLGASDCVDKMEFLGRIPGLVTDRVAS